ncbi:UDP-N-acetylenolpyruvoylglucosamine reductase [hydrothermal vent metagenome]|uniref:UDP-N-acetylmuramate dehydrogenase n=1 Tax=hydrothermal vent metagenome TaxID=652676 RepID=A0A1W1EHC4_9ZZZZ
MQTKIINFAKYSSIKVGSPIEVLIIEKDDTIPKDRVIIGGANNLLVSPNPPPLMMLSKDYDYIKLEDNRLTIGGATKSGRIFSFVKKNNISGFEFLSKLPGTLGGLVAMNAGLKDREIFNLIHSVKVDNEYISKDEIDYGYRYAKLNGVVTEVIFDITYGFDSDEVEILKSMRSNQPSNPSAGSAFKNPMGDYAGRLIDEIGLKGFRKGDMAWSDIHANFLVNLGDGSYEDAIYLINEAKSRVRDKFGIELQEEILILSL